MSASTVVTTITIGTAKFFSTFYPLSSNIVSINSTENARYTPSAQMSITCIKFKSRPKPLRRMAEGLRVLLQISNDVHFY
ncbi:MAG: hypothetical protein HFK05_04195 [Clostridia bacterium]|nr:hypothetical protein [Clostridia bacterium]